MGSRYDAELECKKMAQLFAIAGYRNSEMENVHHDYHIPDSKMKELNKDICNRIYELFLILWKSDYKKFDRIRMCYISDFNVWNMPENKYCFASKEYYKDLK